MPSVRFCLPCLLALLPVLPPEGRAGVLADSRAQFTGAQGEGGWSYGYRNLTLDGGGENYDPVAAFIPFAGGPGQGAWNGGTQQFDEAAANPDQPRFRLGAVGSPPFVALGRDYTHPSSTTGPYWTIRRYALAGPGPGGAQGRGVTWRMSKQDFSGSGSGVTGAIYLDGQKLDEVSIHDHDAVGFTRTVYFNSAPGAHRLDLVLKPTGPTGVLNDHWDATWMDMVVFDTLPDAPVQPDGTLFLPQPVVDADADGLPDAWEVFHAGGTAALGPAPADADQDGVSDAQEYANQTSPLAGGGPVLRWSFNERPGPFTGATSANAVVAGLPALPKGWGLRGTGRGLALPGGGQEYAGYIDLPNGILSRRESCTIEGWVSVDAGENSFARIFDFGDSSHAEIFAPRGIGGYTDSLLLSASQFANYDHAQYLAWTDKSLRGLPPTGLEPSWGVHSPARFGEFRHVALTVAQLGNGSSRLNFWMDGVRLLADQTVPLTLAQLNDVNAWLGRSQDHQSGNLAATYDEFRVYDRALSEAEVLASRAAGPDAGLRDTDGDGMPDYWEALFSGGGSPTALGVGDDADGDGLGALAEYQNHADPTQADTDGDGRNDGEEVNTLGTNPRHPDLQVATYQANPGVAVSGSWSTAADWSPNLAPNDSATARFDARVSRDLASLVLDAPTTLTRLAFSGATTLSPATPADTLLVRDTLRMGGTFRDMGRVAAGSAARGGVRIVSASVAQPQSNWLEIRNTEVVNRGPDGLVSGEEFIQFFNNARLVNEGTLHLALAPTFYNADGAAGNRVVNRGRMVLDSPGALYAFHAGAETDGGEWDLRHGDLRFTGLSSHTNATFHFAPHTTLTLPDNAASILTGDCRMSGEGDLYFVGGRLTANCPTLGVDRIVMERGQLSGAAGGRIHAKFLELRSAVIDHEGVVEADELRFADARDWPFSNNQLVLRKVRLNTASQNLAWAKNVVPANPVDPLPAGITLGQGAVFTVGASNRLDVTTHLKVAGEAPQPGRFVNEGRLYKSGSGGLEFFAPFVNRGQVDVSTGAVYVHDGGENHDPDADPFSNLGLMYFRTQSVFHDGGVFELGGNTPKITFDGPLHRWHTQAAGLLRVAAGAQAFVRYLDVSTGNAAGEGFGVQAQTGATLTCDELAIFRGRVFGPGSITTGTNAGDGLRLLAYGNTGGADGDLILLNGAKLKNAGPAGLITKGFDGGVIYNDGMILDENCELVNEPTGVIDMRMGLDFYGVEHAPGDVRGGRIWNRGRWVKSGGGQSVIAREVGFVNDGTLEIRSGTVELPGKLDNNGTITLAGNGVTVNVPGLGIQGPGFLRLDLAAYLDYQNSVLRLQGIYNNASLLYGQGLLHQQGANGSLVSEGAGAVIQALGGMLVEGIGKALVGGLIVAPGAGGGIVAPGVGIVAPGAGGGIVAPGAGGGIVAPGAGVVSSGPGSKVVVKDSIVASGAGGGIVASGAGSVAAGSGIVASGAGGGIGSTGAGSRVEAPSLEASGTAAVITAGAGGQIVAPGAGGGIVTPGAGYGIVASGAGSGIVAAGAGIVAPGAGGGIVGAGGGAGALPWTGPGGFALSALPISTNTAGMVRATGIGSFIRVENQGLVWADVGITAAPTASIEGNGVLQAPVVNPCGVLSPGHATGLLQPARPVARLDIDGALVLESTSRLDIELGGVAAGSGYDQVRVTGAATLAGGLRLTLRDGFTPSAGETFTILDANAVAGGFANVAPGARLATEDGRGSFVVNHGAGSPFAPGDVVLSDFQFAAAHAPQPFAAWHAARIGVGAPDVQGDREPDGFPDGLEYALGGDPLAPGDARALTPRLEVIDGVRQWVVEYPRSLAAENAGTRYYVQYSTNLSDWRDERDDLPAFLGPAFFQVHEPAPGGAVANGTRAWRARCPAGPSILHTRLALVIPP